MRPTRRSVLTGGLATLALPSFAAAGTEKRLLVVMAAGGWDVTYVFDPKLGLPGIEGPEVDGSGDLDDVEALQTISGIPLLTNPARRPAVSQFFERWGSRSAVVNGLWMGQIAHLPCRVRLLTGTASHTNPDFSVITGYTYGGGHPLGSVDLSGRAYSGPLAATQGRFGMRGQIRALTDRSQAFPAPPGSPELPGFVLGPAAEGRLRDHVLARAESMRAKYGDPASTKQLDDLGESVDRAVRLVEEGSVPIDALPIGEEPSFQTQADVAVGLLEAGIAQAVMIDSTYQWDTHYSTEDQHDNYQGLFSVLDGLLDQLQVRGMLEDTLVCVLSEMTRTPQRNAAGGKDHWPHTSAMFLGGGVSGGRVLGATDDQLLSAPMDLATGAPDPSGELLKYDNLVAGVLEHVGVDPGLWLPGVTPFRGLGA